MKPTSILCKAPGKLILSGEHAVLLGAPVLATAVSLYATTTLTPYSLSDICFDLINLKHKRAHTRQALHRLSARLQKDYQRFRLGEIGIRRVVQKPFELVEYTVSHFLDRFEEKRKTGVHIHHHSDIPVGCGMGSSAASIISTNWALNQFYEKNLTLESMLALSLDAENLQHGYSSGIDLFMATHGGTWLIDGAQHTPLSLSSKLPLFWVNTGTPQSSTGECVACSKAYFAKHPDSIAQFRAVTEAMAHALDSDHLQGLKQAFWQNQDLLTLLGVVPLKIQNFLALLKADNLAGKVCGAGSVAGERAGMLLLCGDQDLLTAHCQKEGWILNPLVIAKKGVESQALSTPSHVP